MEKTIAIAITYRSHETPFLMGGAFMMAGFLVELPKSLFRTIRLALIVLVLLFLEAASQIALDTREFN